MIETQKPQVSRSYVNEEIPLPKGVDVTNTDAVLNGRLARKMVNVIPFDNSIKSSSVASYATITGDSPIGRTGYIVSKGYRWGAYKRVEGASDHRLVFVNLEDSTSTSPTDNVYGYEISCTLGEKLLLTKSGSNTICFELVYQPPGVWVWTKRVFGMPEARISSIASSGSLAPASMQNGKYQYGVDFAKIENGVTVRSSGVSRRLSSGSISTTSLGLYFMNITVQSTIETGWTHVRLWRSKNLKEVDGVIAGDAATLYCTAIKTVSDTVSGGWVFSDFREDSTLPLTNSPYEAVPTTPEVLDLDPIRVFPVMGVVGGYKLFMSGLTDDQRGVYSSAAQYATRYEEQYSPADRIGVAQGAGDVLSVGGLSEDLIVATEMEIFRLPGADFNYPLIPMGGPGRIKYGYQIAYVEGFGIICFPSDGTLRYCGLNYQWSDDIGGKIAGEGIREAFTAFKNSALIADYSRGILHIGVQGSTLYYSLFPGMAWVQKSSQLPGNTLHSFWKNSTDDVKALWVDDEDACYMEQIGSDIVSPEIAKYLVSELVLGPIQASRTGDGLVELMEFRIEGSFGDQEVGAYVQDTSDGTGMFTRALVCVNPHEDSSVRSHIYKVEDMSPTQSRPIAQRLFIGIRVVGSSNVLSQAIFNAFTARVIKQLGGQYLPGDENLTAQSNLAYQEFLTSNMVMRFTRPTPLTDFYGNGPLVES